MYCANSQIKLWCPITIHAIIHDSIKMKLDTFYKYTLYLCITDKPEPPSGRLQVRKVSHESVVIEWNISSDDGGRRISRYRVEYRDNDDLAWHLAATVDGYTTSCTVSGLKENREYLFRVVASNEIGESDPLEVDLAVRPQRQAG